jgi:hypothetical protein
MMGVVGTGDIDALESAIESLVNTVKIVNGLAGNEANHQNGESKTPQKLGAYFSSFLLRKKF